MGRRATPIPEHGAPAARPASWTLMIVPHKPGAATRTLVVRGWMVRGLSILGLLALIVIGTLVSATHQSALQTVDQLAEANRRAQAITDSLKLVIAERDSIVAADAIAASVAAANAAAIARAASAPKPRPKLLSLRRPRSGIMLAGAPRDLTPDVGVSLPVDGRITSGFSHSRFHPILGIFRPHHGVDVSAPAGTPIVSPAPGVVHFVGRKWQAGLVVEIEHANGIMTRYEHCRTALVHEGDRVAEGGRIATVGSTGLSTGPHVHYEVLVNGTPVDPLRFHFAGAPAAIAPVAAPDATNDGGTPN